ncbi:radical SAM protein [Sulfolobus acidocaldarius]|uniref:Uncharacterized protein n=4 Tax=Sulfolobus acidocaldarius TaxID=2285 RepID=Q4JB94_SULAC|nr:radical SAM protein [Sulfolobus acidocaldarius]AAY79935.1 hypothetical protein Saci_0535 [Sulfolobus acidocaldarius DSM 639]AGE70503.1 hypothetical protein SacN8_02625 [Sulfolobus acidocaldarius N8]AGE72776.1 hypothetical protein SacRon12I_02615 [Sulfolobus acidocaldarius Ron12/I]ALU29131.1 hypothetical protein ATY89_03685 [Sulfolobus acidocaldarius]ALU31857.1 hypothetical protein ATZ20_06710 [Sulfolobus acidocaldarius]
MNFTNARIVITGQVVLIRPYIDYVEEIIERAFDIGFEFVGTHQLLRVGHIYFNYELLLISDEKEIDKVLKIKHKLNSSYEESILFDFDVEIMKGLRPLPNTWGQSLIVALSGDVFGQEEASCFSELSLVNIKRITRKEIWEKNDLLRRIKEFKYPEKCSHSELKTLCRGGSRFIMYLLTRDLMEDIPGCHRSNRNDQKR